MLNKHLYHLLTVFTFLFVNLTTSAQTIEDDIPRDTLLVGVAGSEPFVFTKGSVEKGIALDIWENLAEVKGWNFKYIYYKTVDEALHSIDKGNLDIVVGPISITSQRVEYLRFSQPFYNSSLAIVSRADNLSLWDKVQPFFSLNLLYAVFVFLFILSVVGTFLWLAERKKSPDQFPSDPLHGIGTGMWLAIVTMSTTGYGDKAPITLAGRVIAGTWMIVSIIFATSMVAGIASTLTLSSLGTSTVSNIEELSGQKAATITNSPSALFLKESRIKPVEVQTLEEAMEKLKNKEVQAVVYDRPQMLYYLKNNKEEAFYIAKAEYAKRGYGYAFSLTSDLVYEVNRVLLELAEEKEVNHIIEEYLDRDE
jgi:polar amino acid transport system substrate-binding protein